MNLRKLGEQCWQKVGLLATGDEIINGDVVDTNSPFIAHALVEHAIQPGMHMTASDTQSDITTAIHTLLNYHQALIIVGGLGPTSDDRTRFALSEAIAKPLIHDEASWQRIIDMLTQKSLQVPDSNRQQCLFPEGAEIIVNTSGTASACYIQHNYQDIFMLPGPPNECQPIFDAVVLPKLIALGYSQPIHRATWLLLGVSEGHIAAQLDPIAENSGAVVGYRVDYPYLEVKLHAPQQPALEQVAQQFNTILQPQLISTQKQKASRQLIAWLQRFSRALCFEDSATGGLLEYTLTTPSTYQKLEFHSRKAHNNHDYLIKINGLDGYWQQSPNVKKVALQLQLITSAHTKETVLTIPFRGPKTPIYAMEYACWQLLKWLATPANN